MLQGREIVVGVCGGIAAFKAAALVSKLAQAGAGVTVVLTDSAREFVGGATFEALSGRPVATESFNDPRFPMGAHIELAQNAQLLCVAPATANFLAKAAHGIADDLLSTLILAFEGPMLLAPAMSDTMWNKPPVQRNLAQVRADGFEIIDPQEGWLSCRRKGVGRMAEPETVFEAIERHFTKSSA